MRESNKIEKEIVERLKPFDPDRIILFGSHAYGHPTEESDIDIFLIKNDLKEEEVRSYRLTLQKRLFPIQKKYLVGIDLIVDSGERIKRRIHDIKDQFYQEIITKGRVLYAK